MCECQWKLSLALFSYLVNKLYISRERRLVFTTSHTIQNCFCFLMEYNTFIFLFFFNLLLLMHCFLLLLCFSEEDIYCPQSPSLTFLINLSHKGFTANVTWIFIIKFQMSEMINIHYLALCSWLCLMCQSICYYFSDDGTTEMINLIFFLFFCLGLTMMLLLVRFKHNSPKMWILNVN